MAEYHNLYQRAIYYDIVFDRDVSREVDFITAAYRHYTGTAARSVLDIACGPGYHAREFARRGMHAVGLDLRPEMVQLAREKDATESLAIDWVTADMRFFKLDTPVDVAITMFDGIDALTTNDDFVQHLRAVANNLTDRGLYVIDFLHPRACHSSDYGSFRYAGERNGTRVDILWGANRPRLDCLTGVADVEVEMHVTANGVETVIHDSSRERILIPQEILLLAELSGSFKVVGWYGDFDLERPLDDSPASCRMVVVLQKQAQAPVLLG